MNLVQHCGYPAIALLQHANRRLSGSITLLSLSIFFVPPSCSHKVLFATVCCSRPHCCVKVSFKSSHSSAQSDPLMAMTLFTLSKLFHLSSLFILAQSYPLRPQDAAPPVLVLRRVAYSIVAVDGGSAATSTPAMISVLKTVTKTTDETKTITASATATPPLTKLVVSTKIISESQSPKTVMVTKTQNAVQQPATESSPYSIVDPEETAAASLQLSTSSSYSSSPPSYLSSTPSISTISTTICPTTTSFQPQKPSSYTFNLPSSSISTSISLPPQTPTAPASSPTSTVATAFKNSKSFGPGLWHQSYPYSNATWTSKPSCTAYGTGRIATTTPTLFS